MAWTNRKFYKRHSKTNFLMLYLEKIKNEERRLHDILCEQLAYLEDEECIENFNDDDWISC